MLMSNVIVPKEEMPAYQRWELASFDKRSSRGNMALPTAEELEHIEQQSREEGYKEGRAQAAHETQRLHALLESAGTALGKLDQTVADDLLALALDVARQMLGQALKLHPELVLPVIQDAVRCLPQFDQTVRVVLHPQDAALVRAYMAERPAATGWIIVEDATLACGGCRVETASSEVDATMQSRWQRVLATLGNTEQWLAP